MRWRTNMGTKTKIKNEDLRIERSSGFSYDDFPAQVSQPWSASHKERLDVYLGKWQLATIVYTETNKKWYVSKVFNKGFKSKEGAIRGILERLNSSD